MMRWGERLKVAVMHVVGSITCADVRCLHGLMTHLYGHPQHRPFCAHFTASRFYMVREAECVA